MEKVIEFIHFSIWASTYASSLLPSSLDWSTLSGSYTSSVSNSLLKLFLKIGIVHVKNNTEKIFADFRGFASNFRFVDSILVLFLIYYLWFVHRLEFQNGYNCKKKIKSIENKISWFNWMELVKLGVHPCYHYSKSKFLSTKQKNNFYTRIHTNIICNIFFLDM